VWHDELRYAGTFDAIGKTLKRPSGVRHPEIRGQRLAFDLKTNKQKRIYFPQHYFQLAAYRHGLDYHGVKIDGEAIISLGPSGEIKGKPYSTGINFVPAHLWPPMVAAYRAIVEAQSLNPNARKKK
jgi:hypothetical protein